MNLKIISGGQTGSDFASILTARRFGIETGGWLPKGCETQNGPRPEYVNLYGMKEYTEAAGYKARTWANVRDSDGTVRIATNFFSPGEICTKNGILHHKKHWCDIDPSDQDYERHGLDLAEFVQEHNIKVLNVAGNTETSSPGIFRHACWVLRYCFEELGFALQDK